MTANFEEDLRRAIERFNFDAQWFEFGLRRCDGGVSTRVTLRSCASAYFEIGPKSGGTGFVAIFTSEVGPGRWESTVWPGESGTEPDVLILRFARWLKDVVAPRVQT